MYLRISKSMGSEALRGQRRAVCCHLYDLMLCKSSNAIFESNLSFLGVLCRTSHSWTRASVNIHGVRSVSVAFGTQGKAVVANSSTSYRNIITKREGKAVIFSCEQRSSDGYLPCEA